MLVKFETKTSRVKGLAFHPKRPWVLCSYHNGSVQIWDYRMGTAIDTYNEHEGPVRGCAFHPTQPLFVTGGDDGKIRVYNYQQRRCLFTLSGHSDYVRTVFFHEEAPWIISASDDQTVRIWNWQSRSCLTTLTGHTHYVMCAQFHPSEDLVVSASLDQTVRVWDVSGLKRKRSSASASPMDDPSRMISPRVGQIDLFSAPDAYSKFVLEGHDRGVNWVQFHPSKPLIVSGSDDRTVKIWRYNDSRGWETDTLRGHLNNVSCVMFHPRLDVILSNSEDKTMRIWDYTKKGSAPTIHRRENDRFWILAAHPTLNMIGCGHDSGFIIFKTEHERPAFTTVDNQIFVLRDRSIYSVNVTDMKESLVSNLEQRVVLPATMSFSPSDGALLLSSNISSSTYALFSGSDCKSGPGNYAIFLGRNRFAVLSASENKIYLKASDNTNVKTLSIPSASAIDRLFPSPPGSIWIGNGEVIMAMDVQSGAILGELSAKGAKYAVWNSDFSKAAFFGKSTIHIVDRDEMTIAHTISDLSAIKSAIWDPRGILFFTSANHFKYVLPNGDMGLICTVKTPVYLAKVVEDEVFVVDRDSAVHSFAIDPTEFLFKMALLQGDQGKVMQMIESSNLMGQAIIAYLREKGHSHLALGFVQDPATRFELGIESGNLESAFEDAVKLDKTDFWSRLADGAMALGNFTIAEKCLQRIGDHSRLSFLYVITGNVEKIRALNTKLPADKIDLRIQNNIMLGDGLDLAGCLSSINMPVFAYLAEKGAGASPRAPPEAAGLALASSPLLPADPLFVQSSPWPLKETKQTAPSLKVKAAPTKAIEANGPAAGFDLDLEDLVIEDAGWEINDVAGASELDIDVPAFDEASVGIATEDPVMPTPGEAPTSILVSTMKHSPFNLAACGEMDQALRLLHEKYEIIDFKPLEHVLLHCVQGSVLPVEMSHGSFVPLIRLSPDVKEPHPLFSVKSIKATLESAYQLMTSGKFVEAREIFESAIHSSIFIQSENHDGDNETESEVDLVIKECLLYLIGIRLELQRREVLSTDPGQALIHACNFAQLPLRPEHRLLALRSALSLAYKLECLALSGKIAVALLKMNPPEATATQAKKVVALAERLPLNHVDPIKVPFEEVAMEGDMPLIDPQTLQLIAIPGKVCKLCKATYSADTLGINCAICKICSI